KVLESPQIGMDRLVPPLLRADRPRAADVAGLRAHGIVRALARRHADGMDGREVEDVEAHLRDLWQALDHVAEGAVRAVAAHRAREELVPAREPRPDRIDR